MSILGTKRRAKAQLDRLTELVPVGIIRTDTKGRCVYVNERWCKMTGLTREETRGEGWLKAIHPHDRERVLRQWRRGASEAREFGDEFRLRPATGEVKVVSSRCLPLFDKKGKLVGQLCASTDITERQETEQALRQLTQEMSERAKELNCLFGISHIVEQASGSLTDILTETVKLLPGSWQHSEVASARIVMDGVEYKTENYADSPWKQVADILVHGERVGAVEVCYLEQMPERDEGPFLAEERSLIDAVAARLGRTTERLRAEQLLHEREQELRERLTHLTRVSVMGEMASSIAHEVNQPLTAISAYAQACKRMIESGSIEASEVLDVLARVSTEARRAGDILHRLKDLVQRHESKRSELDINKLVQDVERLASVDARLHDVRLRLELAGPPPPVRVDGVQIQQVVLNLIRNAIDAMSETEPDYREVVLRTAALDGDEVEVSVTDQGCGLPHGSEGRLFEPFFTTKKGGIGMGLSISRSIVAAHGGRMWFESNEDRGVTFHFTIPAAREMKHGRE